MAGRIFSKNGSEIIINFVTSVDANATIEVSSNDNANKWSTIMAWQNMGTFIRENVEHLISEAGEKITEFVRSRNEATRSEIVDHVSHMASPSHVDAALEKLVSDRVLFMWNKEVQDRGLGSFFARRLDANEPVSKPAIKPENGYGATDEKILEFVSQYRIVPLCKIVQYMNLDPESVVRRVKHLQGDGKLFRYVEPGREDLLMVIGKPVQAKPDKLAQEVLSLACDLVGATQQAERWEAEEKAKNKEAWALQQKAGWRLEEAALCGRKVEEYRKEEAQLRRQIKEAIERSQKEGPQK